MTIHFAGIPWIMIGSGVLAVILGGFLVMTFDISDRLPPLGMLLVICGIICAALGAGAQFAIWAGIH